MSTWRRHWYSVGVTTVVTVVVVLEFALLVSKIKPKDVVVIVRVAGFLLWQRLGP